MTAASQPLRVLYLEDNLLDADLALRELAVSAPQLRLEVATTLAAALERLIPAPPCFDAVLTDLSLPDGSGLELLAHIRERELPIAVVILTGTGDQVAALAALKGGADDYLVKRTDYLTSLPRLLTGAIASFRNSRVRLSGTLRVLYAEPHSFDGDLARRYLAEHAPHIRLELVGSGVEVLARFPLTPGASAPPVDVLLLDYCLPGFDALELVKILRKDRGLGTPIVLVTGQGTEDLVVQALRLGANDYLLKCDGYLRQLPAVLEKVQKQAELNRSEERYRRISQEFNGLLDAIPDALMLLDQGLTVLWANSVAAGKIALTAEEMVGRSCHELWYDRALPCESCPVLRCFASGLPVNETVTRADGRIWEIRTVPLKDEQGQVAKVIEVKRNITELRKLEQQYLQAQKMESIGTLAGGVAHDFNNILTVIAGLGHVALMSMADDDPQRRNIGGILEAAERAAYLTKELLLFSRKQQSERAPVELNGVIDKAEKFLHRIIGEDIVLTWVPHATALPILADSNQLWQVLLNLAVNARDAMPRGGAFILQSEMVVLDERFVAGNGFGRPGCYALLSVSDTGAGMDKKTLQRIFEPFYTTKEVGKGTGLGLSVVYGIINQHDGFINVYSEPGHGSTFRIYLPLTTVTAGRPCEERREGRISRGTETILLAEDDSQVRQLMTSVLSEAGYTVIVAVDGKDALVKFRQNADSIHLLFFDIIMPGMNGKEAADEIHKTKPGLRTIFASGYAADLAQNMAGIPERVTLIYKPVSPCALLEKVRSVLDQEEVNPGQ